VEGRRRTLGREDGRDHSSGFIVGHGSACKEALHQRAVEVGVWHRCSCCPGCTSQIVVMVAGGEGGKTEIKTESCGS